MTHSRPWPPLGQDGKRTYAFVARGDARLRDVTLLSRAAPYCPQGLLSVLCCSVPSAGTTIAPVRNSCEECAAPLTRACANCDSQLSPTAKFRRGCASCEYQVG